jgi:pyruvate kinase
MIARYRPIENVLVLTDDAENANKMTVSFGCYPIVTPTFKTVDEILKMVREITVENKLAKAGDKVVIIAGMPFGEAMETNFLLVETL